MQANRKPRPAEPTASSIAATFDAVLTVAEVAAMLKVPKSSIYEWTRFRTHQRVPLPHRKVGKYLRFLRSEIDAWLIGLPQATNSKKRRYVRKVAA
jgi:excisionase family DNA binding protein